MESSKGQYMLVVRLLYSLLFSILLVLAVTPAYSQQSLSVIANQQGTPSNLSFKEMKSVLMGERQRWSSGEKVLIALIKTNNKVGLEVSNRIYNMKPDELNKYWLALVFQGKVSAPYFFNTVPELITFVSQNPGAIGIVDEDVTIPEVKTIAVDGKKKI